jgi:hypothetical protein
MVTGLAFILDTRLFSVSSLRVKRQIRVATERAVIASQRFETNEHSNDRGIRRWAVGLTSVFHCFAKRLHTRDGA